MIAMKLLGRTGKVAGHDMVVRDTFRIGAASDNDFQIVVAGVSRHHARIVKTGDAYFLEDAGSTNGTFVNGQRVSRERLRHLDVITLGRDVDLITVETGQVPSAIITRAVEDAWLEPIEAQAGGPRIDVPPGELTIGRVAPSNVLLDSPLVSQLHLRLQRTPDHVVVQDLGSVNGTFVNGAPIKEPVELNDGDTLMVAGIRHFRVHIIGNLEKRSRGPEVVASAQTAVFDAGWKTRLVWSADELAELEVERQRIIASVKKDATAAAPAAQKAPPAAAAKGATPPVVAKPAAAAAAVPPPVAAAPAPKPAASPSVAAAAASKPAAPPPAPAAPPPKPAAPPASAPAAAASAGVPAAAPSAAARAATPSAAVPAATPAAPVPAVVRSAPVPAAAPAVAPSTGPSQPATPKAPAPAPVAATPSPGSPGSPAPPPAAPKPSDAPPPGAAAAARAAMHTEPTVVPSGPSADAVTVIGGPAIRGVKLAGEKGTFQLQIGRHVVGRAEGVAVPILDPQMSRAHAIILVTPVDVRVEDSKSANGTFVNGVKVVPGETGTIVLKQGDRLSFGKVEFTVELIS